MSAKNQFGRLGQNALYSKRRKQPRRGKPMILIIAFKCDEGVALVSDTKMTDTEGAESYEEKVFFPLGNRPMIIGAAGYRDLFREFNSKLPLRGEERFCQVVGKNGK